MPQLVCTGKPQFVPSGRWSSFSTLFFSIFLPLIMLVAYISAKWMQGDQLYNVSAQGGGVDVFPSAVTFASVCSFPCGS